MAVSARQLPGIYFENVGPPVADSLPRMDIAAFVGFAGSGPLHTPVPVDDAQRFREIFGADVALAWDRELKQIEYSHLGPAVEAFFHNGGRRCWVVRVADEQVAQTAYYEPRGLYAADQTSVEKAVFQARSPGGWADDYTVAPVLQVRQYRLDSASAGEGSAVSVLADGWHADITGSTDRFETGDLIRVTFADSDYAAMLYVDEVVATDGGVSLSGRSGYWYSDTPASPAPPEALVPDDAAYVVYPLSASATLGLERTWPAGSPSIAAPSVSVLRLQVIAWRNGSISHRLSDLGFHATHSRFVGHLPSDSALFERRDGRASERYAERTRELIEQSSVPRFPFCATEEAATRHWLPLGVEPVVDAGKAAAAMYEETVDRQRRNGLINFGSRHFLDDYLRWVGAGALKREALDKLHLSEDGYRLRGIYSLMPVEEVTLISVPDAVHRRWNQLPSPPEEPLAAPELITVEATDGDSEYRVEWSVVDAASAYTVEWSRDGDWDNASRTTVGGETVPRVGEPPDLIPVPDHFTYLHITDSRPATWHFRVRAERQGRVSPWSNHRAALIPDSAFVDCESAKAETLEQRLDVSLPGSASPPDDRIVFQFNNLSPGVGEDYVDTYELQRAASVGFADAVTVYNGPEDSFATPPQPDVTHYYRVRARRNDTVGPWSDTRTIGPGYLSQVTLQDKTEYTDFDLLGLHRSLIRLCAARGDMFGVLCPPRHYRQEDVQEHLGLLRPGSQLNALQVAGSDEFGYAVPALTGEEERAMSHIAFYYPWLLMKTDALGNGLQANRAVPPDGIAVGSIARKSLEQGAWIAPANQPYLDVLALEHELTRSQWPELQEAGVNVIHHTSTGFLALSADTLSSDNQLREINVRRLMSLLLRLAEREGGRYVFEPNSAAFRERVKRHFERVFARLYTRGAFAGRTATEAYRVVTGASANNHQSLERGRLVVELHVAPSRALKFIRVRLIQSGPAQIQVQEVS